MAYSYKYPRPAVTVDCVVFGLDDEDLKVLLIQRAVEPFAGAWALPGGFVKMDESLEEGARRELEEETGITKLFLEQLYSFGDPGRDPRGRVITVAYYALVKLSEHKTKAATDAQDARWFPVGAVLAKDPGRTKGRGAAKGEAIPLAFDHERIVRTAVERLRGKVRYQPIGFELLPKKFTLTQLQRLYETVLEREIDKRNFRKKILAMNLLEPLDEWQEGVSHRAPQLFRFDERRYKELTRSGFSFEI